MNFYPESTDRNNKIIQFEALRMNISESELAVKIVANTCGCKETKGRYCISL